MATTLVEKINTKTGQIIQVVGVVVDVEFTGKNLPPINNALKVKNGDTDIVLEVLCHL